MTALAGIDVVVLAGGLGTRLRSVLADRPKILAPVGERPFLDHLAEQLAAQGARSLVLSLGHLADQVLAHLGARALPLPVRWVIEDRPLGTAGGLRLALPAAESDPVLVMNGDTCLSPDFAAFRRHHAEAGRPVTLLCARVDDASRYGTVDLAADGSVAGFVEKDPGRRGSAVVSAGALFLGGEGRALLAAVKGSSLERDYLAVLPHGSIAAHVDHGGFLDIGTPESLRKASVKFPVLRGDEGA